MILKFGAHEVFFYARQAFPVGCSLTMWDEALCSREAKRR